MRELGKIVAVAGVRATAALLAFITAMVATRIFAPAEFGKFSLLWSTSTVAAVFLDLGASIAFRKLGHKPAEARVRVGRAVFSYTVRALLGLTALLALIVALPGEPKLDFFLFSIPLSLAFAFEIFLAEIFRVRQMYFRAEAFSGGFRQSIYLLTLGVTAVLALPLIEFTALYTLLILVLALTVVAMAGRPTYSLGKSSLLGWETPVEGREQLRFFLIQALILIGQQFPMLAAGAFATDAVAGTVRISLLFGMLMQFAIAANSLYFAPKLAQIRDGDDKATAAMVRRSTMFGLAFVPGGLLLAASIPLLVHLLFGANYDGSVFGAQIVVLVHTISSAFGAYAQMLLLRGWDKVNLGGAITVMATEAVLIVPLQAIDPLNAYTMSYAAGIASSLLYLAIVGRRRSGMWPGALRYGLQHAS